MEALAEVFGVKIPRMSRAAARHLSALGTCDLLHSKIMCFRNA